MKKFNEKDALAVINQMVGTARRKIADNSFYFLLWGWTTFGGAMMQYVLMKMEYGQHYLPWPILSGAATVTHIVYAVTVSRNETTKSYLDYFLTVIWICTWGAISLAFVLCVFAASFAVAYMMLLVVYGLGTLITGILIKFKPLIFGAAITWLCSINMLFVSFPEKLIFVAVSIAFGYIVPGHILRRRSRNGI